MLPVLQLNISGMSDILLVLVKPTGKDRLQ